RRTWRSTVSSRDETCGHGEPDRTPGRVVDVVRVRTYNVGQRPRRRRLFDHAYGVVQRLGLVDERGRRTVYFGLVDGDHDTVALRVDVPAADRGRCPLPGERVDPR